MKKLLVTFGCSWTYGVGVNYELGMSFDEFKKNAWDADTCNQYSFRGLLSQQYNYDNINFSHGGSSNQAQFRFAENFFSSERFKNHQKNYKEIVVLWGITSVLRNEIYFVDEQKRKSFFYTNELLPLSKCILMDHFDINHEMYLVGEKIQFWDNIFECLDVKNIWFDTFNHHEYNHISQHQKLKECYQSVAGIDWPSWDHLLLKGFENVDQSIKNKILDSTRWDFYKIFKDPSTNLLGYKDYPRDLLSKLAIKNGLQNLDSGYHLSNWAIDNDQVKFLTELGLLNPYTLHPTKQAHQQIVDLILPYL